MSNNYDEIDNLIFNYFNKEETVPDVVKNGIKMAFNNKQKKNKIIIIIKRIIITLIGGLSITGGVVFADNIEQFVKSIFNASQGVETAIENNYIYDNEQIEYIESNGTKIRINSIVMDDFNINMDLVAIFDEEVEVSNTDKISISDMIITDEKENIIFFSDIESLRNYCYEKNIEYNFDELYNKSLMPSMTTFMHDSGGNTGFIVCNLMASTKSFPKSKELKVEFGNIIIESQEKNII